MTFGDWLLRISSGLKSVRGLKVSADTVRVLSGLLSDARRSHAMRWGSN
jgi:hypothetical protein